MDAEAVFTILSGITFIFVFLPLTFLFFLFISVRYRNVYLLFVSLVFLFLSDAAHLPLLLFSAFVSYISGIFITHAKTKKGAKAVLVLGLAFNISLLVFFKYISLILKGASLFLPVKPFSPHLPIGLSFYTFEAIAYIVDVYTQKVRAQKKIITFASYFCFFPKATQGPIVRYSQIEPELYHRNITLQKVSSGICRFVIGLSKKVLIANILSELCSVYRTSTDKDTLFVLLYAVSFTLEIYYDFSGYSDMAIGIASLFGFDFPENFDYPYISKSVSEFWRRWHKTLSSFFRDYVYIPLGGNRKGVLSHILNICVVWLLTGLWHGSGLHFAAWGVYYALLLVLEKYALKGITEKAPSFILHFYVTVVTVIGFMLFNASSMGEFASDVSILFSGGAGSVSVYYAKSYLPVIILSAVGATPLLSKLFKRMKEKASLLFALVKPTLTAFALVLCTAYIVNGSFAPFLYFKF